MTEASLRVWTEPPPGVEPRRGRDLILHAPAAGLLMYPEGTLADDLLEPGVRAQLDGDANAALARWREETQAVLQAGGLDLGWLLEGELYADVFVRERAALAGLKAAVAETGARRIALMNADADLTAALRGALEPKGVEVHPSGESPPPAYPIAYASSIGRRRPLRAAARELFGVPGMARGSGLLLLPGAVIEPLWPALRRRGLAPVVDLANPPGVSAGELARRVVRGGVVGHPGRRARSEAKDRVTQAIGRLDTPGVPGEDPLAWLERRRAATLLADRAPEALARHLALRPGFARGLRGAVLPSDGTAPARALISAARESDAVATHVQHGFFTDLWHLGDGPAPYLDGLTAGRAAVWSEAQGARMAPHAAGRVEVTGNPAAANLPQASGAQGAVLILLHPSPTGTPAIDRRAPARFLRAALEGVAAARVGTSVLLRPHPLDPSDYTSVSRGDFEVQASGPLAPLLARARACVGPVSTATLTAAAVGLPTVHLDVSGPSFPEPFGDSGLPRACSSEELAQALSQVAPGDGADAARQALGARPDAIERVLDLAL